MFGINKKLNVHFIGIGGIGMSGIAEVLLALGYKVSGSDVSESESTRKLEVLGANIYIGHNSENVKDAQLVVYSSAVKSTNPEYMEAQKQCLPIIKRAEMLSELMRLKKGIAIAGSHGKTTTTSFLATILNKLNYKPTYIIGGIVKNLGGHAHIGESDILVAEADESDGSFLYLNPIMSIITNIDNDHLDYYQNIENLKKAFVEFLNKIPFYGKLALNVHDRTTSELLSQIKRPYLTFGIEGDQKFIDKLDYIASDIVFSDLGTSFKVKHQNQIVEMQIKLSGKHNVLNALGAISIAHQLGSKLTEIASVIYDFEGVGRRLELLKKVNGLTIIDDYAHHPTEIKVTLETVRNKFKDKKLITIFEPHRYTRTQNFWSDFVEAFDLVDEIYISPIYAASEEAIEGINSKKIVEDISKRNKTAHFIDSLSKIEEIINLHKNSDSIILTLGAGPISKVTRKILDEHF